MSNEQYYASYGFGSGWEDLPILLWTKKPTVKQVAAAYLKRINKREMIYPTIVKAEIVYAD